ncbi:hypothetical protein K438DRAFT_1971805 [Mycena galopus ATCC 62051]|nr:hypothetical protein K438DRAFT_1971805 [Mycena galopus ATCC 62051]
MDGPEFPPHFLGQQQRNTATPPPLVSPAPVAGGLPSFAFPSTSTLSVGRDPTGFYAHDTQLLPSVLFPSHSGFSSTSSWDAASASSWLPASMLELTGIATQWNDDSIQPHWDDPMIFSFQPGPARPPSTVSSAGDFFDHGYGIDYLMASTSDEYSSSQFSSVAPSSIPEDDWSSRWSSGSSRPVSAAPSSVYGDLRGNSPPPVSIEIGPWDSTDWAAADLPCVEPDVRLVDDLNARLGWDFKPSNVKWLDPDVSSEVTEFSQGIRLTEKTKIYALHRVTGCVFLVNLTNLKSLNPDQEVTVDQLLRDQDSHSWGRSTGSRSKVDAYLAGSFFGLPGDVKIACRRAAPECGGVTACESLDPAFLKNERRDLDPNNIRIPATATLRTREMQDDTEVGRTLLFHHSLQRWHCKGIRPDGMQCDGSICLRRLNTPDRNKNHILLCSKRGEALKFGTFHSQVRILDHVSEELFVKVMDSERIIEEDDTEAFNHHKNGLPYIAKVEPLTCSAKMHIFCPWETLHSELALMAIVVPFPESGHSHPPPPRNKCTHAIAERYRGCVQVAIYLADQEALCDEKRYLQSSLSRDGKRVIFGAHPKLLCSIHDLRTLDCDTTFKPVVGEMQIFKINGWLVAINESVTVMRVWMEFHDRAAYKTVWEEIQRLVLKLTKKQLKFKGLHKGGKILGLNSDMEAAPLLGFVDAFVPTVDLEHDALCLESLTYWITQVTTRKRIFDLKYLKTHEEVETFKAWIVTLADPQGVLKRWWDHKLLRGIIQCLSNIPFEQWNTMEATTNLGEAQHAWNNSQTGTSMGLMESFKKYEELDIRRAEGIESRMSEKARHVRAADSSVAGLQMELSEKQEDLAVAREDAKAEPSAEVFQCIRKLEEIVAELEGKLKLAKAEAKSPLTLVAGSTLDLAGTRRASTRKRVQDKSSVMPSVSSTKRRKKLEDPLAKWVMRDPDTGEELTGHEWVKRHPDEFKKRYKKDHQRYLDYLAQSADS